MTGLDLDRLLAELERSEADRVALARKAQRMEAAVGALVALWDDSPSFAPDGDFEKRLNAVRAALSPDAERGDEKARPYPRSEQLRVLAEFARSHLIRDSDSHGWETVTAALAAYDADCAAEL